MMGPPRREVIVADAAAADGMVDRTRSLYCIVVAFGI